MTPEEAIQQLEFDRAMILFDSLTGEEITPEMLKLINKENYLTYVADGIAIEALKEVQKYREIGASPEQLKELIFEGSATKRILRHYQEIGTVEACREAMEKQKAKKPLGGADINGNEYMICRECSAIVEDGEWRAMYCPDCGQAIQWDENLEE